MSNHVPPLPPTDPGVQPLLPEATIQEILRELFRRFPSGLLFIGAHKEGSQVGPVTFYPAALGDPQQICGLYDILEVVVKQERNGVYLCPAPPSRS